MPINQRILIFLFLAMLPIAELSAQQLQGRVTDNRGVSLEGVTVVNKTKKRGTVTNIRGAYQIGYTEGDTIQFSFLGYSDFELVMQDIPEDIGNIDITLEPSATDLEEVVVNSDQISEQQIEEIIEQNFGAITPERRWTQTERRAYTASSAGYGAISLDYFLNLINGRIKRIRMLSSWEKQDALITELQNILPDGFFQEKLGLKEEEVYPFLLFCVERASIQVDHDSQLTLGMMEYFQTNLQEFRAVKD